MLEVVTDILVFMLNALKKAWPFILISIPLSAVIKVSGAAERIRAVVGKNPVVSILLATLFGALSPLCSCTVIPVIFSLLVAGVPLAPVMSFWIASPSMDPEIFFLSVSTLGWNLAVWRLVATFLLSLGAGFAAHYLTRRGVFAGGILRINPNMEMQSLRSMVSGVWRKLRRSGAPEIASCGCTENEPTTSECCTQAQAQPAAEAATVGEGMPGTVALLEKTKTDIAACGCSSMPAPITSSCCSKPVEETPETCCGTSSGTESDPAGIPKSSLLKRILKESLKSLIFVGKFMIIAYFIEALIILYVPETVVISLLGKSDGLSIVLSTLFGLPFYTTNLAALGILGGLLEKGMVPGAALAFLISGPTTTLPAMSAVFGIAKPKVFIFYLGVALFGAVIFGALFALIG